MYLESSLIPESIENELKIGEKNEKDYNNIFINAIYFKL